LTRWGDQPERRPKAAGSIIALTRAPAFPAMTAFATIRLWFAFLVNPQFRNSAMFPLVASWQQQLTSIQKRHRFTS